MNVWVKVTTHVLDGSTLELRPEFGSNYFFVHDTRSNKTLTGALPLKTARNSAQRLLAADPQKYGARRLYS